MFAKQFDVMVVGGGAAGLMAAGTAASRGSKVVILEKNPVLGKKLLITGKGRCNLTNNCDVNDLIANTPVNGKFLTNAFYRFSAADTITFFNDLGLTTKIERGNRVFPQSDKAIDVVHKLMKYISKHRVQVIHSSVQNLQLFGHIFAAKLINNEVIRSEKLIIATGGKSYPATGSTGDGYKFARSLGHATTRFKPSLVPIEALEFEPPHSRVRLPALQGLDLKNIAIEIIDKTGKKVYEDFGELQFTGYGVSGPVILSATSHLRSIDSHILCLDLKPALDYEMLDLRLQREFKNNSNKQFRTILKSLLPAKMIPVFVILSGIPANKPAHQITRTERETIRKLLKNFKIRLDKFRSIKEAIITSGGIKINEIDPRTMESKLVPGLHFAGEIINADAYTGGFNLQIAWSTGYCAGLSCSE